MFDKIYPIPHSKYKLNDSLNCLSLLTFQNSMVNQQQAIESPATLLQQHR